MMTTHAAPPPDERHSATGEVPFSASARGLNGLPLMGGGLFDHHPVEMTASTARPAPPPTAARHVDATQANQRQVSTIKIKAGWLTRVLQWLDPRR